MSKKQQFAVIGGGSWATAIVKILTSSLDQINWWIYEPEIIDHINSFGHNPSYLSTVEFEKEKLNINNNIQEVIIQSDVIIFCFPAVFLDDLLDDLLDTCGVKGKSGASGNSLTCLTFLRLRPSCQQG